MAALEPKVANIDIFLKICMIFGFYHNVCSSAVLRYIIKILLVIFAAHYMFMGYTRIFWSFQCVYTPDAARAMEYTFLFIFSFYTENEYLLNYFSINSFIDDKNYTKYVSKKLIKIFFGYIISIACVYFLLFVSVILVIPQGIRVNAVEFVYKAIIGFSIEIGRLPVVMIFFLLYFRVKIFCKKLRKEVLNDTMAQFDWKDYLKIYVNILDVLKKTDFPIKFMMIIQLAVGFIGVTSIQFHIVRYYRTNVSSTVLYVPLIARLCELIYIYIIQFFPSFMMETISEQLDVLKIDIANRMITCNNERRRSQLRELLKYLREQPLKYCIWRSFHVNFNLPLSYLSLAATYLVCLLQLTHSLDKS